MMASRDFLKASYQASFSSFYADSNNPVFDQENFDEWINTKMKGYRRFGTRKIKGDLKLADIRPSREYLETHALVQTRDFVVYDVECSTEGCTNIVQRRNKNIKACCFVCKQERARKRRYENYRGRGRTRT